MATAALEIAEKPFLASVVSLEEALNVDVLQPASVLIDPVTLGSTAVAPPSGDTDLSLIAGENLSALKVVRLVNDVVLYSDASNLLMVNSTIGVTVSSGMMNGAVTVRARGVLEDASFSFTTDMPVYLGQNGALTQIPPTAPLLSNLRVGTAVGINKLNIQLERPIKL